MLSIDYVALRINISKISHLIHKKKKINKQAMRAASACLCDHKTDHLLIKLFFFFILLLMKFIIQLFSKFIEVIRLTFFSRGKQIWRLTSFWRSGGRSGIRFSTLTSSPSSYLWFILSIISLFVLLSNFFLEIHDIMLLCCFCRWLDFIFMRILSHFFMDTHKTSCFAILSFVLHHVFTHTIYTLITHIF